MENKIKDKEIIQNVMDALGVKAPEFAKKIGLATTTTIYNVKNEVHGISNDLINRIIDKYPEVNYLYLKRGQGSPLRSSGPDATIQKNILGKSLKEITLHELYLLPGKVEKLERRILELESIINKKSDEN